jgi:hypothetical protein
MLTKETVTLFNLAAAPLNLSQLDDLSILRQSLQDAGSPILRWQVGNYDKQCDGPPDDCVTREVTFAEFLLHKWLMEQGAQEGEIVLLTWEDEDLPPEDGPAK